jgi:hypothetical protein
MALYTNYPVFLSHAEATCFRCNMPFTTEDPRMDQAAGNGQFSQHCTTCDCRTWYDLPDYTRLLGRLRPEARS